MSDLPNSLSLEVNFGSNTPKPGTASVVGDVTKAAAQNALPVQRPLVFAAPTVSSVATIDLPKTAAEASGPEGETLIKVFKALAERFQDKDPADPTKPGPKSRAFLSQNGFMNFENTPKYRIRIGIEKGIHTYATITMVGDKPVAQLYAMVPTSFSNLLVPELTECGVSVSPTPFTRPSDI